MAKADNGASRTWGPQEPQGPVGPQGETGLQGPAGGVERPGFKVTTLDSAGYVGDYTSITIGADGLPVINYFDNTHSLQD